MAGRLHATAFAIDRGRLAAFAGILAGLNAVSARVIETFVQHGAVYAFGSMGGISAGVWFALAGCYLIAQESREAETASGLDKGVAAGMAVAAALPVPVIASLAVLGGGLYFALASAAHTRTRRIGIVLLAVSGALIGGKLLLALFAPYLLPLDGAFVAALAHTHASGNVVAFKGGAMFVIGSGCSSIHNLTFALLLWGTLTQLLGLPITWRLVLVGVLAMAGTAAVNVVRLVAIALYPQDFDYLHTGGGALIFGWAALLVAATIVWSGAYVETRPAV